MFEFPCTMATQHPDNADRYITVQEEPQEAVFALTPQEQGGLGIEEIMIDFEGKLTPYHQTVQAAMALLQNGIVPGRDVRITPRIPNAKHEPLFRQMMSMMSLVETNFLTLAHSPVQAIQEAVVPMIESGQEILETQARLNSIIELGNKTHPVQLPPSSIKVIPLIESVPALLNMNEILNRYKEGADAHGFRLEPLRIMFARSDSALSCGLIAAVLAVLTAIDTSLAWGKRNQVTIAPILGCGALPFRGHMTAENLDLLCQTYGGARTFTLQSALRYDHGEEKTKEIVARLKKGASPGKARGFTEADLDCMLEYTGIFAKHYLTSFVTLAPLAAKLAALMPKNRDRLSSSASGLSYHREGMDTAPLADLMKDASLKQALLDIEGIEGCPVPRAIGYTAALYTIGMPPEFIGTGRGLQEIQQKYGSEGIHRILTFYPQLLKDLQFAAAYVHLQGSIGILPEDARLAYADDHQRTMEILNVGNPADASPLYRALLETARPMVMHLLDADMNEYTEEQALLKDLIAKMGKIRGSLG